jgi:hypothetical protein
MSKRAMQLFFGAGMVVALVIGPTATAGSACPTSSGPSCERVGPRLDEARTKAKQQRVRPAPRILFERDGQSVWRAGNHIMY